MSKTKTVIKKQDKLKSVSGRSDCVVRQQEEENIMKTNINLLNRLTNLDKIRNLIALGKLLESYKKGVHLFPCPLCKICGVDNIHGCDKCSWIVFADTLCTIYVSKKFHVSELDDFKNPIVMKWRIKTIPQWQDIIIDSMINYHPPE